MDYYLVTTPAADLDRDRLRRFFADQQDIWRDVSRQWSSSVSSISPSPPAPRHWMSGLSCHLMVLVDDADQGNEDPLIGVATRCDGCADGAYRSGHSAWPGPDAHAACLRRMCVRLDQPQQVGPSAIWSRLSGYGISLAGRSSRCGTGCTPRRCRRPLPGDDVLCRVLAEALVPRANEQAADMAAVINLARAVAVVWRLLPLR